MKILALIAIAALATVSGSAQAKPTQEMAGIRVVGGGSPALVAGKIIGNGSPVAGTFVGNGLTHVAGGPRMKSPKIDS